METEVIHIINLKVPQWEGTNIIPPGSARVYCEEAYCLIDYVE